MRFYINFSRSGHYTVTVKGGPLAPTVRYVKISDLAKAQRVVADLKAGREVAEFRLKTLSF